MKKNTIRVLSCLLCAALLFAFSACEEEAVNIVNASGTIVVLRSSSIRVDSANDYTLTAEIDNDAARPVASGSGYFIPGDYGSYKLHAIINTAGFNSAYESYVTEGETIDVEFGFANTDRWHDATINLSLELSLNDELCYLSVTQLVTYITDEGKIVQKTNTGRFCLSYKETISVYSANA